MSTVSTMSLTQYELGTAVRALHAFIPLLNMDNPTSIIFGIDAYCLVWKELVISFLLPIKKSDGDSEGCYFVIPRSFDKNRGYLTLKGFYL